VEYVGDFYNTLDKTYDYMEYEGKYHYLCRNNMEIIMPFHYDLNVYSDFELDDNNYKFPDDYQPLGTAFCEILNSAEQVEQLIKDFNDNTNKYIINNSVEDSLCILYDKLLNISKYFKITDLMFRETLIKIDYEMQYNKNILNVYKEKVNEMLLYVIYNIRYMQDLSVPKERKNIEGEVFVKNAKIDESKKIYLAKTLTSLSYKINNNKINYISYSHIIQDIKVFLQASFYQIKLNKKHIKICIHECCKKYFVDSDKKDRGCLNSYPDNPNLLCRDIKRHSYTENIIQEKWEIDLEECNVIFSRVSNQFLNANKKAKTEKERTSILNNHNKLKKYSKELRKLIANAGDTKKEFYLNIYKKFIDEQYSNVQLSPKIFKVTKPKY